MHAHAQLNVINKPSPVTLSTCKIELASLYFLLKMHVGVSWIDVVTSFCMNTWTAPVCVVCVCACEYACLEMGVTKI